MKGVCGGDSLEIYKVKETRLIAVTWLIKICFLILYILDNLVTISKKYVKKKCKLCENNDLRTKIQQCVMKILEKDI